MLNVVLPPGKVFQRFFNFLKVMNLLLSAVKILKTFKGKPLECESLHHLECPCYFGFKYENKLELFSKILEKFTDKVIEVANREEFHDRDVNKLWKFV